MALGYLESRESAWLEMLCPCSAAYHVDGFGWFSCAAHHDKTLNGNQQRFSRRRVSARASAVITTSNVECINSSQLDLR
eukprot:3636197-Pleurochrysis_carterae.AAC.4